MKLTWKQTAVLRFIADAPIGKTMGRPHRVDMRKVSEVFRHNAIDLGMMEPPLIDIDGDWLFITPAGRTALEGRRDR